MEALHLFGGQAGPGAGGQQRGSALGGIDEIELAPRFEQVAGGGGQLRQAVGQLAGTHQQHAHARTKALFHQGVRQDQ